MEKLHNIRLTRKKGEKKKAPLNASPKQLHLQTRHLAKKKATSRSAIPRAAQRNDTARSTCEGTSRSGGERRLTWSRTTVARGPSFFPLDSFFFFLSFFLPFLLFFFFSSPFFACYRQREKEGRKGEAGAFSWCGPPREKERERERERERRRGPRPSQKHRVRSNFNRVSGREAYDIILPPLPPILSARLPPVAWPADF